VPLEIVSSMAYSATVVERISFVCFLSVADIMDVARFISL